MADLDVLYLIGDAAEDRGDFPAARRAFERGAALGHEWSVSRLAMMFDLGLGVDVDKRRAMRLYLRTWRMGSDVAGNNLAILYREKGNARGERRWFERAAERGDDGARIDLAKLYLKAVPPAPETALRLLAEAKAGVLSEAEAEEADALIANLRPRLAPLDDH